MVPPDNGLDGKHRCWQNNTKPKEEATNKLKTTFIPYGTEVSYSAEGTQYFLEVIMDKIYRGVRVSEDKKEEPTVKEGIYRGIKHKGTTEESSKLKQFNIIER